MGNSEDPDGIQDFCDHCAEQGKSDKLVKAKDEIERLQDALRAVSGGCRMLSEGDKCDCGLCKRDREIHRLREAPRKVLEELYPPIDGSGWLQRDSERNCVGRFLDKIEAVEGE